MRGRYYERGGGIMRGEGGLWEGGIVRGGIMRGRDYDREGL